MKIKENIQERLHTESGKDYWDDCGAYSALLKDFCEKLVQHKVKPIRCMVN